MIRTARPAIFLLATTAVALALAGCKPDDSSAPPVATGAPPIGPLDPGMAPVTYGPAATPAPTGQVPAYAYPQRAYAMSRVAYRRPPSYAFGYGDEQPYVWDDGGQGTMFAEPIDDGYRYYYYEPGEAYPYFVQDPDYGYAYGPDGALIALFGVTGALIAADHWRDYAPRAEGYWSRGYDLDRVYRHTTRYPVQPAIWRAEAPAFYAGHDRWFRAAQAQPGWRQAQAWAASPVHDNGRHLGWFKDRGHGGGRQLAFAAPPAQRIGQPQPVRIEHGQSRNTQGWRQARQERPAQPAVGPQGRGGGRPDHGPQGWREAHAGGGPQPQHGPPAAVGGRGGWTPGAGDHGAGRHGGGQAFARAAPQPQPHGGGQGWRGGGLHEGGGHGPAPGAAPGGWNHGGGQAFARAPDHGGGGGGPHGGGGHGPGGGNPGGGGGQAPQGGGGGGHEGGGGGNHGGGKGGGHGHDH